MTENKHSATNDVARAHPDEMVTTIVSAYVANNAVPKNDLPELINSVRTALSGGDPHPAVAAVAPQKATPAEIKKSITPDALISFIDGRPFKTLKRHLGTHGLTFEAYKARFGLPVDYPSVAPNYREKRSQIAKGLGLGHTNRKPADV